MTVSRIAFRINAASASVASGDSGQLYGCIQQMAWRPVVGDTGADLSVTLCPLASGGDTAGGITVVDDADCMGSAFTRVPLQPAHSFEGADTGVDAHWPFVGAGDRLRVKVQPGGSSAVAGTLYVWCYSGN
jgi:hypothetical protein